MNIINSDTKFLRFIISIGSLLWALLLLWPGDTFSRESYSIMREMFSETIWGTLFLVSGSFGLLSLINRVSWKIGVIFEGFLGCLLWTSSCLMILFGVYPPPAAISAEIVLSISSWWVLAKYPTED